MSPEDKNKLYHIINDIVEDSKKATSLVLILEPLLDQVKEEPEWEPVEEEKLGSLFKRVGQ